MWSHPITIWCGCAAKRIFGPSGNGTGRTRRRRRGRGGRDAGVSWVRGRRNARAPDGAGSRRRARRTRFAAGSGHRGAPGHDCAPASRRKKGRNPIMPTKSTKMKAKSSGLNKKQLTHLEKRLLEERARVIKELGHYGESFNSSLQASDGDLSSYSFHMADQGTDAMEREKQFLFASQEGRYLWHVNEALRRRYTAPERFGRCEQCGDPIGFDGLA